MRQIVTGLRFIEFTRILLRSDTLTAVVMKSTIFWDITPCSPLKVGWRFGATYRLHSQGRISRAKEQRESRWQASTFTLASYLGYSALKMEAICYSETSADFKWTTRCYISEAGTLDRNIAYFQNSIQYKYFRPLCDITKYLSRLLIAAFL
jgi:hypothetical protein